MSEKVLCMCPEFELWYADPQEDMMFDVCSCGHSRGEHVSMHGSCLGESEII